MLPSPERLKLTLILPAERATFHRTPYLAGIQQQYLCQRLIARQSIASWEISTARALARRTKLMHSLAKSRATRQGRQSARARLSGLARGATT